MATQTDLLDAMRDRFGWSDYRIAKKLGVTGSYISAVRAGKKGLGEETATKVAKLLGKDPLYIFAVSRATCAKHTQQRKWWASVAKKTGAWMVLISLGLFAQLPHSTVQAAPVRTVTLCILCKVLACMVRGLKARPRWPAVA